MSGFIKRKRFLFLLIYSTFATGLLFCLVELLVRRLGHQPWKIPDIAMTVEPGGRLYEKHPTLGYCPLPGKLKVTIPGPYSFYVTHLDDNLRITHPLDTYPRQPPKPEIWIFGCSFTYGWTVNDEGTYPWLLQNRLPNYEVVNFGVSSYSTVHSLIQFREALQKRAKPKIAILAYSGFLHDKRNVFPRSRRKLLAPVNKLGKIVLPYARMGRDGRLRYLTTDLEYQEIPFMRYSALIHGLERAYNKIEDNMYHSHDVSKALIKEFPTLCKNNNIEFVVAGIFPDEDTQDMLEFCKKEGIMAVDISVDPTIKENTNLPYDGHPSAIAHEQHAEKLESFLSTNALLGANEDQAEKDKF